jgi:hypothetical protein
MAEDNSPIQEDGTAKEPENVPAPEGASEEADQAEKTVDNDTGDERQAPVDEPSTQYESPDEADELNEHVRDPGDPDGLVAAEERRRWEETRPTHPTTPTSEYKPKRLWPRILITVIVITAAAYGAYWIGNHEATKNQTPAKKQSASQQAKQTPTNPNQTVAYTSTNYNLSFNYLKSWTISDTTAELTVISPAMTLTTTTGSKNNAHVVVTIQNPVKTIPGYPSAGAVASIESQDFSYAQPTQAQSAQTYVSYVGYTSTAGLDAIYVTGNSGYTQGQIVPMSDITQVNPYIGVQFETCSNSNCANGKAITLKASDWQSSIANKDVTNLIESLQLED